MNDIPSIAGKLAAFISLSAFAPYILSILRKQTKPNRASWIIWAVVSSIIALSYREAGASFAFLTPAGYVTGSLIVLVLSIQSGTGGWSPFDRKCLLGALISLLLWRIFKSPMSALLINLFINFIGTLPTIKKTWRQPESESKIAWSLFSLGTVVNVFAIDQWIFSMAVYPVAMFFIVGAVTVLLFWTKRPRTTGIHMNREKCPYGVEMKGEKRTECRFAFRAIQESAKANIPLDTLNARDWVNKGVIFYKSGEYENAIHAFSIAIDLDVTLCAAYFNRAVVHYKLGNKNNALKNLKIAAGLGHKNARYILNKFTK